jgi:hypothetical protein
MIGKIILKAPQKSVIVALTVDFAEGKKPNFRLS